MSTTAAQRLREALTHAAEGNSTKAPTARLILRRQTIHIGAVPDSTTEEASTPVTKRKRTHSSNAQ